MDKKHKTKNKNGKNEQEKNSFREQDHDSFFQKLSKDNILSDGMLSEVDQTDLVNRMLTEASIVPPISYKGKDIKS
ncbi:hypothetical protein QBE52_03340 [Clostridiaceae bacterium 35-E11]